jgi:hypothetical protein
MKSGFLSKAGLIKATQLNSIRTALPSHERQNLPIPKGCSPNFLMVVASIVMIFPSKCFKISVLMGAKSGDSWAYRRIDRSKQTLYRLTFVRVARPVKVSKSEKMNEKLTLAVIQS